MGKVICTVFVPELVEESLSEYPHCNRIPLLTSTQYQEHKQNRYILEHLNDLLQLNNIEKDLNIQHPVLFLIDF